MNKLLRYISFCLVLFIAVTYSASDASAFFVKFDLGKTPSKLTNAIQNIKTKAEEILDGIQNSQFGKFVGKGIEKAKEAKGFISGMKEKINNIYGKVQNVVQSPVGQSAIISTKIAKLEVQKSKAQEQNQADVKAIEEEIEILKTEADADIESLRKNIGVLETRGDTAGVESIHNQITQIENQLNQDVEVQNNKLVALNEEHKSKITALDTEVKALATELAAIAAAIAKDLADKGLSKVKKSADEAIKDTLDKISAKTHAVSIKEELQIKKARIKQMQESSGQALVKMAKLRNSMVVDKDNIDANADVAATYPGESEASNALGETLANQIRVIRNLVDVLIEDLKTQTAQDVNNINGIALKEVTGKFNLCDYADPEKVGYNSNKKTGNNETETGTTNTDNDSTDDSDEDSGWGGML